MIKNSTFRISGIGSSLLLLSGLFISDLCRADTWPLDQLRKTFFVFSANREKGFVDSSDLIEAPDLDLAAEAKEDDYHFFVPEPSTTAHLHCLGQSRGRGYLQTDSEVMQSDRKVSVAIPIKLSIAGTLTGSKKEQALALPFIKVSIQTGGLEDTLLSPLDGHVGVYSLRDFYRSTFDPETAADVIEDPLQILQFDYNKILVSPAQFIPAGTTFSVRVEWSAEALCRENSENLGIIDFQFGIGDQFRILNVI